MKNWSAALKAHMALGSTHIATCWKATLTNGTVVTATSHDRDIVFDGLTYLRTAAYTPSDVESGADLAPDNLELEGFLASPAITSSDVHTGDWDYAAIEIFEVNYKDLTQGRNRLREGTLGEVKAGKAVFRAELRGLTQAYSRRIVRLVQKECDADLGDSRCGVSLTSWTVVGVIDAVTDNRQFTDTTRTEANDMFAAGKITFTSGANSALGAAGADLSMEVKESTAAGVIKLHEMMPFDIAVGDTYSMYAGCTKRFTEDCLGKFDNVLNFRGFPHLPGSRIYAGPGGADRMADPITAPTPTPPPEGDPPVADPEDPEAPLDLSPDAFSFTPVTGATASSAVLSDIITVGGMTPGVECWLTMAGPGTVGVSAAATAAGLGSYSPTVERFVVHTDGSIALRAMVQASPTPGATVAPEITVFAVWGYGATYQSGTPQAATFSVTTAP